MKAWIIASAVFVTLAMGANAQEPPNAAFAAMRTACEKDVQTYCPGMQPRTPERAQCIQTNKAKFSKACQDALAKMPKAPPPPQK